jgi:hypothetical protein
MKQWLKVDPSCPACKSPINQEVSVNKCLPLILQVRAKVQARLMADLAKLHRHPMPGPPADARCCLVCYEDQWQPEEVLPNGWCGNNTCKALLCKGCAKDQVERGMQTFLCACRERVSTDTLRRFLQ